MANLFKTILCPVDFSDHSRQALGYAGLLASRNDGHLVVVYIEDPMLVAAAAVAYDEKTLIDKARLTLRKFVERTIAPHGLTLDDITLDVAVGRPHDEITWTADRLKCDVIVLGAHGRTGANRMMLGSTTHRILRRSPLPVLAVPPVKGRVKAPPRNWPGKWVLAPIDLSARDRADALAAAVVARELGAQLLLVHVVEPVVDRPWLEVDAARRNQQLERRAMAHLSRLKDDLAWAVADCRVVAGHPAEKIAAIAAESNVGLVVMTRRAGQGLFGPRQGSISYQVLLEAGTPVLALPSDKQWMRRAVALRPERR